MLNCLMSTPRRQRDTVTLIMNPALFLLMCQGTAEIQFAPISRFVNSLIESMDSFSKYILCQISKFTRIHSRKLLSLFPDMCSSNIKPTYSESNMPNSTNLDCRKRFLRKPSSSVRNQTAIGNPNPCFSRSISSFGRYLAATFFKIYFNLFPLKTEIVLCSAYDNRVNMQAGNIES